MALSIQDKARFLQLASDLSPENLHCDGEISRAAAERKRKTIMAEWRKLEAKAGQRIDEDDAYRFSDEVRAWRHQQRAAEMAALPQHPLLTMKNPGVWSRAGKSGGSAYYIWGPPHVSQADRYELFSEFSYKFGAREKIGNFPTLEAAAEAGEAFLKTVSADFILAKYPNYSPEAIKRELGRLPEGFDPAMPEMPPVTGFRIRLGNEIIADHVDADDVGQILIQTLIERGQNVTVEAVG